MRDIRRTPQLERMLSVKEFAARAGWGDDTIRRMIRRGLIRAYQLPSLNGTGKHAFYRIPESELGKFGLAA